MATGPIKDENTAVVISLMGRAKVKLNIDSEKVPYFDDNVYFSFRKVLFRGLCNVEDGSSATCPFTFELALDAKKIQNPLVPKEIENGDGGKDAERNPPNPIMPLVQKETPITPKLLNLGHERWHDPESGRLRRIYLI